jgi:hypothetical protein
MGEIVYSASVLKALGVPLVLFMVFTILGFSGLGMAIFKRKDKMFSRLAMGCAGTVLCLAAVAVGFLTARSYLGGTETVNAHLNKKRVVTENCDSSTSKCTRYVLEMQSGSTFYDVAVSEEAFNSVEEDACYAVTYYPNDGLLGKAENADSYQSIGGVTRIETAACP